MATLSELYNKLVSSVYEDDMRSQEYYLSMVEDQRKIPVNYLLERGALFIPNKDYIRYYLGSAADTYNLGFYDGDYCNWTLFVIFPITDLVGDVVGIVGWDANNKNRELTEGEVGLPMYNVSNKHIFQKDRYFLSDVELLHREFDKRILFVVDGVFDSIALNYRGIPAISLLGSMVSREVLYFLRWYKCIYTLQDNDTAGTNLYKRLAKALPKVHRVFQSGAKDIEELLRGDGEDGPITKQIKSLLTSPVYGDTYLKL